MDFKTHVKGIPCWVSYRYTPGCDMRITGTGYGDCDPPEPPEIDYTIYDRRGRVAKWLEAKIDESTHERLCEEIEKHWEKGDE